MTILDPWPGKYFARKELQCKCGCGGAPTIQLIKTLDTIREELGFPLTITSGFRCSTYNLNVASSGSEGPHTKGLAVDIQIYGEKVHYLIACAMRHGVLGIGCGQRLDWDMWRRYIHLDWVQVSGADVRRFWSY